MVRLHLVLPLVFFLAAVQLPINAFSPFSACGIHTRWSVATGTRSRTLTVRLFDQKDGEKSSPVNTMDGVVELADNVSLASSPVSTVAPSAPFLSQGEIDPQALNPDLSDPKQARVIIYIILSLIPVLFLIPLMLGSRELIPLENLPPVPL